MNKNSLIKNIKKQNRKVKHYLKKYTHWETVMTDGRPSRVRVYNEDIPEHIQEFLDEGGVEENLGGKTVNWLRKYNKKIEFIAKSKTLDPEKYRQYQLHLIDQFTDLIPDNASYDDIEDMKKSFWRTYASYMKHNSSRHYDSAQVQDEISKFFHEHKENLKILDGDLLAMTFEMEKKFKEMHEFESRFTFLPDEDNPFIAGESKNDFESKYDDVADFLWEKYFGIS